MSAKPPPGLFITGTDTGVGKTHVGSIIARRLRDAELRVGVYKPVLSGYSQDIARVVAGTIHDCQDDDVLLWQAAGSPHDLVHVCPQRFQAPLAPHLAARVEGREVDSQLLRSGVDYWRARSDFVLVEGAGGLMSPLSENRYNADLAYDLEYPLIIVSPNRLGVMNQTLQALVTAANFRGGLKVAAVVLNDLPLPDASRATNFNELQQRCSVPVVKLAADNEHDVQTDWLQLVQRATIPAFPFVGHASHRNPKR
jgi:dethiobiotin synthetase